ncbi:TAF5-like RNA polymerase II p300/CBP-associated factor-associated factor 65 kDa subunit 5L [Drosophila pseudoobscura]|uniref:TAF5-like RNA polymerase II p300/CBP-associated factor-associated factor 65 kDa subunit 5L n=1 Tax=Drosophila pseudoobscura pseudoobscura TaxID=46245 RepID=A0A6I8WB21_DROPS|nr:TAF5-like RNA polymerase II p300/CBP-associated factor-associated factor 65 kDa subunit 5L [Drosophila pseudoobscura]
MNKALPSPNDDVTCAMFSADHCTVAFGTSSGRIHVVAVTKDWQDVNSLRRETLISAHQKPVLACAFSPGDSYRFARLSMRLFRGHRAPIKALAYSVCGRFLVSGGLDDLIIVWDATNERMVHCMTQHNAMIESIGFSHCNNLMVVWGKDCHLSTFHFQLLVKCPEMELSSTKAIIDQLLISTVQTSRNGIFLKSGFADRNRLIAIAR